MSYRISSILFAIAVLLGTAACSDAPVGSEKRPFTMYFVPSVEAEGVIKTADDVARYVSDYLSQRLYNRNQTFYVKSSVPTSYVAVVEALGTKKADFAALTTFSYILAKDIKKYDIEAILTVIRGEGETTYKAQFITHKDSGIKKIEDLKGKRFAFTDPASTSGYILPADLLKKKGIPLGNTIFAQKHDNVVTMVYQKQVDAGATYYSPPATVEKNGKKVKEIRDARMRVLTQFPDVEEKVRIVGFTEEIPNEPWVVRKGIYKDDPKKDEEIRKLVQEALLEYAKTKEGLENLYSIYTISGLTSIEDNAYAGIREMIVNSSINLEKSLK